MWKLNKPATSGVVAEFLDTTEPNLSYKHILICSLTNTNHKTTYPHCHKHGVQCRIRLSAVKIFFGALMVHCTCATSLATSSVVALRRYESPWECYEVFMGVNVCLWSLNFIRNELEIWACNMNKASCTCFI